MLLLSRYEGEIIDIGDDIELKVVRIETERKVARIRIDRMESDSMSCVLWCDFMEGGIAHLGEVSVILKAVEAAGSVKIGIEAPRSIRIMRREINGARHRKEVPVPEAGGRET